MIGLAFFKKKKYGRFYNLFFNFFFLEIQSFYEAS